jgi:Tol biopolymer transport system component
VLRVVDERSKNDHVRVSPDGRSIAFDSDRDGQRGVYVAARDGSDLRRVSGSGYAAMPAWAPDGKRLAFARADAANPDVWNLAVLSLDSGEVRPLTHYGSGRTWMASWFPDGRHIAFARTDRLIVLDVTTDQTREYMTPVSGHPLRDPTVAPDGRSVIFQVVRNGAWLLDTTDNTMRCVLTDPTADDFAWSPDGSRVAYFSRRDNQWSIWVRAVE